MSATVAMDVGFEPPRQSSCIGWTYRLRFGRLLVVEIGQTYRAMSLKTPALSSNCPGLLSIYPLRIICATRNPSFPLYLFPWLFFFFFIEEHFLFLKLIFSPSFVFAFFLFSTHQKFRLVSMSEVHSLTPFSEYSQIWSHIGFAEKKRRKNCRLPHFKVRRWWL